MHPLIPCTERLIIPLPGSLPDIHGFGIMVAIGLWLGSTMAARKAKRDGLDPEIISQIVTWLVVGIFVGGHLGHALFYEPREYFENPLKLFKVWDGLSSFGGFIACTGLVIWFLNSKNKDVRKENVERKAQGQALKPLLPIMGYGDALLYGTTFGFGLGRIGCFLAHDHPGRVTDFWLGVYGICPPQGGALCQTGNLGMACHDLGLYEAIYALLLTLVVIPLDKKPRAPGFFMGLFVLLYGPVRFCLDFLRAEGGDTRYFGLTPAQYGSLFMILLGSWLLWQGRGKESYREANARRAAEGLPTGATA